MIRPPAGPLPLQARFHLVLLLRAQDVVLISSTKTTDQRLDISGREERKIAKVIRGPSVPLPLDHGILNLSNPGAAYQESAGRSSLSKAYVLVEKKRVPKSTKDPLFTYAHKSLSSRSLLVLSKLLMSFCK